MENTKLTDEQVDQLAKKLEDSALEDQSIQKLREILDSDHDENHLETETVQCYANVDPVTGNIINLLPREESNEDNDFDLDSIEAEDIEISIDSIKSSLLETYHKELSDADIDIIYKCIKKVQDGGTVCYNDMPASIKTEISKSIVNMSDNRGMAGVYFGNKELRNQMAREFINTLASDALSQEFSKVMTDLQTKIDTYGKTEISKLYSKSYAKQREVLEYETLKIADQIQDEKPNDAKILRDTSKAFHESYTYGEMYKTCKETGKLKVKKFDIEKRKRIYSEFNIKYSASTNNIKDISIVEPILKRHLPASITDEEIAKFVIIFCKYSMNMNPDNISDHTFMYYFIANIAGLDTLKRDKEKGIIFYDEIIGNIINFIDLIKMRSAKPNQEPA